MPYRRHVVKDGVTEPSGRLGWLVELPVYLLLIFTPLAIGTVHLWSISIMFGLSLLAFAALVFRRTRKQSPILLFPLGVSFLLACAFTLLQLIPLPESVVGLLNPGAKELYQYVLNGTGLWGEGSFRSLSLEPPSTAVELVKFLAYSLTFLVVVNFFTNRYRARRILKVVAWSGFLVALVGFFSKLVVTKAIFGIYQLPRDTFFFSSFVNPNHLAGFLSLCAPVSLGLALSARDRQDRALYGFMGVIVGVAVFMSLSRGGIVAFCAALGFIFLFSVIRSSKKIRHTVLIQSAAVVVIALAGYLAYDTIVKELQTLGDFDAIREYNKIRSWQGAWPMMLDHPVVGIGRGAYSTVYPRYKTVEGNVTFTHVENEVLQAQTEWGPIFGSGFIAVFVLVFILGLKRAKHSFSMAGCLAGLFAVGLHNMVDFNLEIGGVALPFVVLLAVVTASPFSNSGPPHSWETRPKFSRKMAMGLLVVSVLLGAMFIPYAKIHSLEEATERVITNQATQPCEPCGECELGRATCELMKHHPADYLAPWVLGQGFLENRKPPQIDRAGYWLARAMYLNPTSSAIHRLTGRTLYFAGRKDQAFLEYRLAAQLSPTILENTTKEVLKLTDDPESAIRATPEDAKAYLSVAKILRKLGYSDAAQKAASLALEKDSNLVEAIDLLGDLALQNGKLDQAAEIAQRAMKVDPLHDRGYLLQGRVFLEQKAQDRAEKVFLEGFNQVPDSTLLAYQLGDLYLSQQRYKEAEEVARRLQTFARSDDPSQARLHMLFGRIQEAQSLMYEARGSFRMAVSLAPHMPAFRYRLAQIEERLGNLADAEVLYTQLLTEQFMPEKVQAHLEKMKQARIKRANDILQEKIEPNP